MKDLYNKSKLDVYATYLEFIKKFQRCPFNDGEFLNIMYKYEIFKEWYNCNLINDNYYNDIVDFFENKIGVCNSYFDEITKIHFINEFIREHYYQLEEIKSKLNNDNDFSLFIRNGINAFNKRIDEFTMYVDDPYLDSYAEELRMCYNEKTSNKYNIMSKVSECINLMHFLYKYQIIMEIDYFKIIDIYQKMLKDDSLKINYEYLIDLFYNFDKIINYIIKTYEIEIKKKIK